jgi:hypothetical protein
MIAFRALYNLYIYRLYPLLAQSNMQANDGITTETISLRIKGKCLLTVVFMVLIQNVCIDISCTSLPQVRLRHSVFYAVAVVAGISRRTSVSKRSQAENPSWNDSDVLSL